MKDQTIHVLACVAAERVSQHAKWGEQNWPDGTGGEIVLDGGDVRRDHHLADVRFERASDTRRACDEATRYGRLTWRHILEEEVAEARAEDDPERLRAELVQVAAVAVAWIEALDRRKAGA